MKVEIKNLDMEDADAGGLTIEMKNGNFTDEESKPDKKKIQ